MKMKKFNQVTFKNLFNEIEDFDGAVININGCRFRLTTAFVECEKTELIFKDINTNNVVLSILYADIEFVRLNDGIANNCRTIFYQHKHYDM